MSGDRWLRLRQAAEVLGVSYPTAKRYARAGRIRATRLPSGQYRVRESDLTSSTAQDARHATNDSPARGNYHPTGERLAAATQGAAVDATGQPRDGSNRSEAPGVAAPVRHGYR